MQGVIDGVGEVDVNGGAAEFGVGLLDVDDLFDVFDVLGEAGHFAEDAALVFGEDVGEGGEECGDVGAALVFFDEGAEIASAMIVHHSGQRGRSPGGGIAAS